MTSAQRARLVLALGLLNLVLASFALAVGIAGPLPTEQGVAGVNGPLGPTISASAPASTPSLEPTGPASIAPSAPASTPSEAPPLASPVPSVEPTPLVSPSSQPSPSGIVVAVVPTPTPTPIATAALPPPPAATPVPPAATPKPKPTPRPTPRPTAPAAPATPHPTPHPTPSPTAAPVAKVPHIRPPCPGAGDGPPGHNKSGPTDRPCKGGHHGHSGKDHGAKGGFVIVFPPLAGTLLGSGRRRILEPLRRHRGTR